MYDRRPGRRQRFHRHAVELFIEHGFHAAVGVNGQETSPLGGGFQACMRVLIGQSQDAEARAIPLLGVRSRGHDLLDHFAGCGADGLGPFNQPRGRPLQMTLMRLGPMFVDGGGLVGDVTADMRSYPLAAMEDLHGRSGGADLDRLSGQGIRNTVVMVLQFYVVIDIGGGCLLASELVTLFRKWKQSGPIHRLKQTLAATFAFAEATLVQAFQ